MRGIKKKQQENENAYNINHKTLYIIKKKKQKQRKKNTKINTNPKHNNKPTNLPTIRSKSMHHNQ